MPVTADDKARPERRYDVRIRACCHACGRDFLFLQLYNDDSWSADRCPHCNVYLGVARVRHLARSADSAAGALVHALAEIASRDPRFSIRPESLLTAVQEAVEALSDPSEGVLSQRHLPPGARLKPRRAA